MLGRVAGRCHIRNHDTMNVHEDGQLIHKPGLADVKRDALSTDSVCAKLLRPGWLVRRLPDGYSLAPLLWKMIRPALEDSVIATASFSTVSDSSTVDLSDFGDDGGNGGIIQAMQQSPFMGFTNLDLSQ